jgi:phage protein D
VTTVNFRQPTASVALNGTTVTNAVIDLDVHSNNYFAADTFRVRLALAALSAQFNASFWSDTQAQISISVDAGGGPLQLILGNADTIDIDMPNGTVEASGRDLTAALIDTKVVAKYQNLTSSKIAAQIAASAGLQANITATSTPAGRYYEIDHARLNSDVSQWTLLNYLAQEEGFDVYVSGNTLNFVPSQQGGSPAYTLTYQQPTTEQIRTGNFIRLALRRSQTLAKGTVVKVISWNSKQVTAFTATAKRSGTSGSATADTAQVYTFKVPGLTQDQAQQFANARLQEISLHERVVDVTIPGETSLTPRQLVALTGTGTSFDQNYYIDSIERSFSMDDGFMQTIKMKNHSAESTVSV